MDKPLTAGIILEGRNKSRSGFGYEYDFDRDLYRCLQCDWIVPATPRGRYNMEHHVNTHAQGCFNLKFDSVDAAESGRFYATKNFLREKTMLKYILFHPDGFQHTYATLAEAQARLNSSAPTGTVLYQAIERITVTAERKVTHEKIK